LIKIQWLVELKPEWGGSIGISDCYLRVDEEGFSVI